jgi:Uma2 family endonuclease
MSIATSLLTAAEFGNLPDSGHPQELIRGVILDMPPPKLKHGVVCMNIGYELKNFCQDKQLGRVFGNYPGIITERNPDSVRGADVGFISFAKIPLGPLPDYLEIPPDALFEVLSPSNRRGYVQRKVAEYLEMGVPAVYVVDPDTSRVHCYYPDRPEETLSTTDVLVGVGALAEFRVSVARFFE